MLLWYSYRMKLRKSCIILLLLTANGLFAVDGIFMGVIPGLRIYPNTERHPNTEIHIGGGLSFGIDFTPHFSVGAKASYLQGLNGDGIADIVGLIRIYINLFPTNHPVIQADLGTATLFEQGRGAIQEFSSGASFGWRFLFPRRVNHTQEWFIEPSVRVGLPHFERPVSFGVNTMAGIRWRGIAVREVRQAEREIAAREAALAAEREAIAREIAAREEAAVREIAETAVREILARENVDAAAQDAVIREIAAAAAREVLARENMDAAEQEAAIREIAAAAAREVLAGETIDAAAQEVAIREITAAAAREVFAGETADAAAQGAQDAAIREIAEAAMREVLARENVDAAEQDAVIREIAAAAAREVLARENIDAAEQEAAIREIAAAAAREVLAGENVGAAAQGAQGVQGIQDAAIREIAEAVARLATETMGAAVQETAPHVAAAERAIIEQERAAIEQGRQMIPAHEVTARERAAESEVAARTPLVRDATAAAAAGREAAARGEIAAREAAATDWQNIAAEELGAGVIITHYNYLQQIHASRIFFDGNSATFQGLNREILDSNNRILQGIAETLNRSPNYRLLVIGHANPTTPEGPGRELETRLVSLSIERARKVVSELVRLGVDRNRLSYLGAGGSMLEIPFNDRENNWRNRRVEFELR